MDINIKDGVYFASLLVAVVWSYAKTNQKHELNTKEIENLKETIKLNIEKEKIAIEQSIVDNDKKLNAIFKKIDTIITRLENLETKSVTLIDKDEAYDKHPTRAELENQLRQLQNVDTSIKSEMEEMKKDINKKLDKLEKQFEAHIKDERENHEKQQNLLNQILLKLGDR